MKKIILAFVSGQVLQIVILWLAMAVTYSTNLLGFCAVIGAVVTIALVLGSLGTTLEMATQELHADFPETEEAKLSDIFPAWGLHLKKEDMEETMPIPDEIEVTNDSIKRANI